MKILETRLSAGKAAFILALCAAAFGLVLGGCMRERTESERSAPVGTGRRVPSGQPAVMNLTDLSQYAVKYYGVTVGEHSEGSGGERRVGVVRETNEPFEVVEYGPREVIPSEVKRPSLYFLFSQPVVPLAELGRPISPPDFISIDPPLAGVFRWYGSRLLSFDAAQDVIPQHEYTVRFAPTLRSLGGKPIRGRLEYAFRTEYLSLSDWYLGDEFDRADPQDAPIQDASRITLVFNYPVNIETIGRYIRVRSGEGSFAYTLSRPVSGSRRLSEEELLRTVVIQVERFFPENSEVTVTLEAGYRSEEQLLGNPEARTISFKTIAPFGFVRHSTRSYSFPGSDREDSNPVFLEFTHPVDPDSLAGAFSTVPSMAIAPENIEVFDRTVKISGLRVPYESSYTIIVGTAVKDIYGRALPSPVRAEIEVGPAPRYAYFPNTGTRMLEAAFGPKIVWEFQNVTDGEWKVASIDDPYRPFEPWELGPYDFSDVPKNVRHFEVLDLSPYLNRNGKGFVGISWNFGERDENGARPDWTQENLMLQVTDLGLTTRYAYNRILAMVTKLSTGEPVESASVSLLARGAQRRRAQTDRHGLAVFELGEGEYVELFGDPRDPWIDTIRFRVEKDGDRIEFEPNYSHNVWHHGIYSTVSPVQAGEDRSAVFIFTDRGLYRPGEEVTFRGIDRIMRNGVYLPYRGMYSIRVREPGWDGAVLRTISGQTTDSGGFYGNFQVPEESDPGMYWIEYTREGAAESVWFQVAEFERLTFSVSLDVPELTFFSGDTITVKGTGTYLAGGGLAGGSYTAYWTREPAEFTPPGEAWESYVFGPGLPDERYVVSEESGRLGPDGSFLARQETSAAGVPGQPYRYRLEAVVNDVSRRQVSARTDAIVHPASFYIGAKLDTGDADSWSRYVGKGENVELEFVLAGPGGDPYEPPEGGTLRMALYREEWKLAHQQGVGGSLNTRWERLEELEQTQEGRISGPRGRLSFVPERSGAYIVELSTADSRGRPVVTRLRFYATGSDWIRWAGDGANDILLSAEKPVYRAGETARILVRTPLPKGRYLITLEREGILEERIETIEGSTHLIEVPITEDHIPIVYVAVSSYSVRSGPPEHTYFTPDLDKPAGYFGIVPIRVDTEPRELSLEILPDKAAYRPGTEARVTVRAAMNGRPVEGAEITFMAVDRGVVDLINYHVPDPVEFFYAPYRFPLGVMGADSRSLLIDPVTYQVKDLPGGDANDEKLEERKDFRPTAVFVPYLTTDRNGEAVVRFTLPDTLTTYRATAVAVRNDAFGISERELLVNNPINVVPQVPGTLRERDTVFSGVIVTNLGSQAEEVSVTAESSFLTVEGNPARTVTVEPGSTIEVPFRLSAQKVGNGAITFTVRSGALSERVTDTVKVVRPFVYETVATIGEVSASSPYGVETPGERSVEGFAEEAVVLPGEAPAELSSLSVTIDSTRLASMKGAFEYLLAYPYGCFEQRASKTMPLVLFSGYPESFAIQGEVTDPERTVREELELWSGYQNTDGGFPFWPGTGQPVSSPYVTLRIAHVLALASDRGFRIPERIDVRKLLSYIAEFRDEPTRERGRIEVPTHLAAYGAYVRSLYGAMVNRLMLTTELDRLFAKGDALGIAGYGFVGLAYAELGNRTKAESVLARMKRFVRPGTRTVDLTETEESDTFYNSQIERLSLLLMLWNRLEPSNELVGRVFTTIMNRQKGGYWNNTADTNWAVLAVAEFAGEIDRAGSTVHATVSLQGVPLLEQAFHGVTAESAAGTWRLDAPELESLPRDKALALRFQANGEGNLFYTAALTYAVPPEIAPARDEGLSIYTELTDLDGNRVEGQVLTAGRTYRVRAVLSSPRRRTFVAVRLPVPSGAEILDASFVTTARIPAAESRPDSETIGAFETGGAGSRYAAPSERQILDTEVRFFFDDLPQGKQELEFLFRAVDPGVFPTPPAQAECMYEPEVFGRNEGRLYFIEPAR